MGRERSGTTLLQVMLNGQPNIVAPPEARFMLIWYSRYGHIKKWTEKLVRKFVDDLYTERLFANFWGVEKEKLLNNLLSVKEKLTYPLLCKIIYWHAAPEGKDVKVFVDKNPIYYHFLPELAKLFPEAKYIHIVRDYRDNMVSHKKVFYIKNTGYVAYHWMAINKLLEEAKNKNLEKWMTLTYEQFVTDPNQAVEGVCKFLGVQFEVNAMRHEERIYAGFQKNKDNARLNLFHENIFKPIDPSHIGEWKQKLAKEDVIIAEAIAGEFAEKQYGYKRSLVEATINGSALARARRRYNLSRKIIRAAVANPRLYSLIRSYWRAFIKDKTTAKK